MRLGNQSVTFVSVTEDLDNRDRYNKPAKVRVGTEVSGCLFRPLTAQEKIEFGDIVTDPWKCTAPPVAAVLNAKPNDEVEVDGISYQIKGGIRPFPDLSGRPYKVTIICDRHTA